MVLRVLRVPSLRGSWFPRETILTLAILISMDATGMNALAGPYPALDSYEDLYDALDRVEINADEVAEVEYLVLEREAGLFTLGPGTIAFLGPVAGRICGAVYVGEGHLTMTPPTRMEAEHLARVMGQSPFESDLETIVFFYADGTEEELRASLSFRPEKISRLAKQALRGAKEYVLRKETGEVRTGFARSLLEGTVHPYFFSILERQYDDPVFLEIDPYEEEEVRFLRKAKVYYDRITEVVSQFDYMTDLALEARGGEEDSRRLTIDHYDIDFTLSSGMRAEIVAKLTVVSRTDSLRWFPLRLASVLDVDSARWEGENADRSGAEPGRDRSADFARAEGSTDLWLRVVPPLAAGAERRVTVEYKGPLVERNAGWFVLASSNEWYPRTNDRSSATYDLTYRLPAHLVFSSVGEKVEENVTDRVRISRWRASTPIRNASFSIGLFEQLDLTEDDIPAVTVHMNEEAHGRAVARGVQRELAYAGATNMGEDVGQDIVEAVRFYRHVFGECPFPHLYATEIPQNHGEAFPGLIHLSSTTFHDQDWVGTPEQFRAHEVAHQWWGIGVDFATYHDQWLSEGFADYSGLWFTQARLSDNDTFFEILGGWRDRILENRSSIFGKGQEAGPIALGYRTNSSTTRGDYDLIIYRKGAWVLHMLRNLLLNLDTMSEEVFIATLQDFYRTYQGRRASTADFQRVVEAHMGMKMDWFFDQWVRGSAIPEYEFAFRTLTTPDGPHLAIQVHQKQVPEDFRMYVPIRIEFAEGRYARVRLHVSGSDSQFELALPLEPVDVRFNDIQSVLCESRQVDWKD